MHWLLVNNEYLPETSEVKCYQQNIWAWLFHLQSAAEGFYISLKFTEIEKLQSLLKLKNWNTGYYS